MKEADEMESSFVEEDGGGFWASGFGRFLSAFLWFILNCIVAGFFGAVLIVLLLDGGKQMKMQECGFKIGIRGTELFDLDQAAGNAVHRSWLYADIDERLRSLERLVYGKQEYEIANNTIHYSGTECDGMKIPDYLGAIGELVKERELRRELNLAERVQRLESMFLTVARDRMREKAGGGGSSGSIERTKARRVPFKIPKGATN